MNICPDFLYPDRSNGVMCHYIDAFVLGSRRDFEGGKICLGVSGDVSRT